MVRCVVEGKIGNVPANNPNTLAYQDILLHFFAKIGMIFPLEEECITKIWIFNIFLDRIFSFKFAHLPFIFRFKRKFVLRFYA